MQRVPYVLMQDHLSTNGNFIICEAVVHGCPIRHASEGFVELFGYSAVECYGKRCGDLVGSPSIMAADPELTDICKVSGLSPEVAKAALGVLMAFVGKECAAMLAHPLEKIGFALVANRRKNGMLFVCELIMVTLLHPTINLPYSVGFQRNVSDEISLRQLLSAAARLEHGAFIVGRGQEVLAASRQMFLGDAMGSNIQYLHVKFLEIMQVMARSFIVLHGEGTVEESAAKASASQPASIASRGTSTSSGDPSRKWGSARGSGSRSRGGESRERSSTDTHNSSSTLLSEQSSTCRGTGGRQHAAATAAAAAATTATAAEAAPEEGRRLREIPEGQTVGAQAAAPVAKPGIPREVGLCAPMPTTPPASPYEAEAMPLRSRLHERLWKTKFCKHHLQTGSCKFGARCSFAHGSGEMRAPPDWQRTQLCKAFAAGGCSDLQCTFAHSEDERRRTGVFHKTTLCAWFERGACCNGLQCSFAHGSQELRTKPPRVLDTGAMLTAGPPADAHGGGGSGISADRATSRRRQKRVRVVAVPGTADGELGPRALGFCGEPMAVQREPMFVRQQGSWDGDGFAARPPVALLHEVLPLPSSAAAWGSGGASAVALPPLPLKLLRPSGHDAPGLVTAVQAEERRFEQVEMLSSLRMINSYNEQRRARVDEHMAVLSQLEVQANEFGAVTAAGLLAQAALEAEVVAGFRAPPATAAGSALYAPFRM